MAGGKNIKTILPSWLLASRVGPVSALLRTSSEPQSNSLSKAVPDKWA